MGLECLGGFHVNEVLRRWARSPLSKVGRGRSRWGRRKAEMASERWGSKGGRVQTRRKLSPPSLHLTPEVMGTIEGILNSKVTSDWGFRNGNLAMVCDQGEMRDWLEV